MSLLKKKKPFFDERVYRYYKVLINAAYKEYNKQLKEAGDPGYDEKICSAYNIWQRLIVEALVKSMKQFEKRKILK